MNPEIVHIHSPLVAAIARPVLAVTPKRPRILSEEHNSWASHARGTRWANRATMRLGDAWLAVSHDVLASIPSSLRGRVKVVTHGIDVEAVRSHASLRQPTRDALDLAADDIVVLTVANLRRQKAYPDLLKAAEQALDSSSKLVFLAVGQGPLERELHQMHGKLGLGDRFRFLGYRTDIPALMAAADMYVLASSHEGLPLVVMEARAAGLTIVATAVGGVPEVVQDGVDGYLVEPGDWLSLGRRISDLATHPELRESMAGASRRGADRFDGRSAVGVIESHYLSCAAAATS